MTLTAINLVLCHSMPLETSDLTEFAVVWPADDKALADSHGRVRVGAAFEVPAKWVYKRRLSSGLQADTEQITATVYVDRAIPIGSILWEGRLKDKPGSPNSLVRVVSYERVPDVKGIEIRHSVLVIKHNDSIPTAV